MVNCIFFLFPIATYPTSTPCSSQKPSERQSSWTYLSFKTFVTFHWNHTSLDSWWQCPPQSASHKSCLDLRDQQEGRGRLKNSPDKGVPEYKGGRQARRINGNLISLQIGQSLRQSCRAVLHQHCWLPTCLGMSWLRRQVIIAQRLIDLAIIAHTVQIKSLKELLGSLKITSSYWD